MRFLMAYEAQRARAGGGLPTTSSGHMHSRQARQDESGVMQLPGRQPFYAAQATSADASAAISPMQGLFAHPVTMAADSRYLSSNGQHMYGQGHSSSGQTMQLGSQFLPDEDPTWHHLQEAMREGEPDPADEALAFLHDPDSDTPGNVPSPIAHNFDDCPTSAASPCPSEPGASVLQGPDLYLAEQAITPRLGDTHLGGDAAGEHKGGSQAPGPVALHDDSTSHNTFAADRHR